MPADPELVWRQGWKVHSLIRDLDPIRLRLFTAGHWDDPVTGVEVTFRGGRQVAFHAPDGEVLRIEEREGEVALSRRKHAELVEEVERLRVRVKELEEAPSSTQET